MPFSKRLQAVLISKTISSSERTFVDVEVEMALIALCHLTLTIQCPI